MSRLRACCVLSLALFAACPLAADDDTRFRPRAALQLGDAQREMERVLWYEMPQSVRQVAVQRYVRLGDPRAQVDMVLGRGRLVRLEHPGFTTVEYGDPARPGLRIDYTPADKVRAIHYRGRTGSYDLLCAAEGDPQPPPPDR